MSAMNGDRFEGFEGSYLGNRDVLKPGSRLECKICWWVYDPAEGDPDSGIEPGTPFEDIPEDWMCPICGATKADFEQLEPGQFPED